MGGDSLQSDLAESDLLIESSQVESAEHPVIGLNRFSLLVLTVESRSQDVGKGELQARGIRSIDDKPESVFAISAEKGFVTRELRIQS